MLRVQSVHRAPGLVSLTVLGLTSPPTGGLARRGPHRGQRYLPNAGLPGRGAPGFRFVRLEVPAPWVEHQRKPT